MIHLDKIKSIYIYPGTTDFRNGIYGLAYGLFDTLQKRKFKKT